MSQKIHDSFQMPPAGRLPDAADVRQTTGSFMGEKVAALDNPMSLIADAAEELTFSASEDVERKLTDRKEGRDKLRRQYIRYVEQCEEINPHDLQQFVQQVTALRGLRGSAALALARQAFADPTHQHAALSFALHESGQELPEDVRAALDEALAELERDQGQVIQAGYNIVDVPAGDLAAPPAALRVLYRDTLIDFESYEKTFACLIDKFGPDELPSAVQYLIRALGADMEAVTPSSPKAALKEVMDGLYMAESLGTLYTETRNLLRGVGERHGDPGLTERQIIEPLLRYKDAPVLVDAHITRDMPFLVSANPSRDAELTRAVRELVRGMPHKVFLSPESRQHVLDAFQALMDRAVDREDAAQER